MIETTAPEGMSPFDVTSLGPDPAATYALDDRTISRLATVEELPELTKRLNGSPGVHFDLYRAPVWVAVKDGQIVGLLAANLMWQLEPLTIFKEVTNRAVRRRATYELYKAAEAWISDSTRNVTGVYEAFAITRKFAVRGWAKKLGWTHQFKRAPLFIKTFKGK